MSECKLKDRQVPTYLGSQWSFFSFLHSIDTRGSVCVCVGTVLKNTLEFKVATIPEKREVKIMT